MCWVDDPRDYDDLKRTDIAVYNFRGYTVFRFNKKDKSLEFGAEANMCCFTSEDYSLMAEFLFKCNKFTKGEINEIEHVSVD